MSTPMTQERIAEIWEHLDAILRWSADDEQARSLALSRVPQDLTDLLAEVKRLQPFESIVSWRYGDTTDGKTREDMVERAARESYGAKLWDRLLEAGHGMAQGRLSAHRAMTRAVLDAAFGTGEDA